MIAIASEALSVEVSHLGAELRSAVDRNGHNWLWHGDGAFWGGRAPLLFPVIGKSVDGQVSIDGKSFPMPPHGVARVSSFELVRQDASSCIFRLTDTPQTRTAYPFAFALTINYTVVNNSIATVVEVTNRDTRPMPFCFGFHPALMLRKGNGLPLVRLEGNRRPSYQRLGSDGLLLPAQHASPFAGGRLDVKRELFDDGALIFTDAGPRAWYGYDGESGVALTFAGLRYLGIWTKPGAPFLCIEPWSGLPATAGQRELSSRAGAAVLAPGETVSLTMDMTFGT